MRIDLIFPGITACGFDSFGRSADPEATFIPHGLAMISAYLKSKGHEVGLIDLRKLKGWEQFDQAVLESPATVFGISSMSCDYGVSEKAASRIKERKPSSTIVIGGVHPTVATDEVLANPAFDYVVTREGEYSLCHLLEQLEQDHRPERLIVGEPVDVTTLPWIDRDLFDFEHGEGATPWLSHMELPFATILTSRGCPYRCRFCQPSERMVFGNAVKIRPVDDVIEELDHLRARYDIRSFLIHDDLFILKPRFVEAFARKYRERGFHQHFACQARSDLIVRHEDRIRMLAEAGLDCMMVGFESGSQRILDFIDKGTTIEQNVAAVKICRKYHIRIFANIMFGLPTETKRDMDATASFVNRMKPEYLALAAGENIGGNVEKRTWQMLTNITVKAIPKMISTDRYWIKEIRIGDQSY